MSASSSGSDPFIIDLTGGISASTSPMMTRSSRSRVGKKEETLFDLDSSEDEGEILPSSVTAQGKARASRSKKSCNIKNDVEDGVAAKSGGEAHDKVMDPSNSSKMTAAAKAKLEQAFLKARLAGVKKRSFDLERIAEEETIPTGRTIKRMSAWVGHWPALREFMQNTIDHLGLLDSKTGRRHEALQLRVTAGDSPGVLGTFHFRCGQESVCSIIVSRDELVIDQLYTFPIAPRALDTGVPDTEKSSSTSAGGFGDGFKTAAVALLALGKDFESLEWHFLAGGQRIDWSFEGATRAAVGTFAKCKVLQVCIRRRAIQSESEGWESAMKENTMRQVIKVRNIGKSFIEQAVPRLGVFWDLDPSVLICSSQRGGDFIGPASVQPVIGGGVLGKKVQPESGVYVKGIWVRKAKIAGTLMCFFGRRLEVNGRDRNDVDEEELIHAVVHVLCNCSNPAYLRQLLSPLKGRSSTAEVQSWATSSSSTSTRPRNSGRGLGDASWLLKSPRFLNLILEQYKDVILHDIMGVPRGAIYVSSKTTKSCDPFVKWASDFLPKAGCPLEPIEPGANRHLFREASEFELVERCVDVLKRQGTGHKGTHSEVLSKSFRKILTFMGLSRAKAIFSPHVAVAFVHNRSIYAPEAPLSRELLVKVLNVCQSHLDGADGERFSSLMQASFENLPPGTTRTLTLSDIEEVIKNAKSIQKENKSFLMNPGNRQNTTGTQGGSSSCKSGGKPTKRTITPETVPIDLTDDASKESDSGKCCSTTTAKGGRKRLAPSTLPDLEKQIALVSRATEMSGTKRKRKKRGGGEEEDDADLPPVIPASDFAKDNAGTDSCLRPISHLRRIEVDNSLGGGYLLCDSGGASAFGRMSAAQKGKISTLRHALDEAQNLVGLSIPSLGSLLRRIRHGYDSANDTYEAFCDGTQIVVNLFAYLPKLLGMPPAPDAALPPGLVHDLAITITHELAHFLEPREGHGPVWRDTHMRMVTEVMNYVSQNGENEGSNKRQKQG